MTENNTIVVGVDGSPSSQAAIRYAAHLVDRFDGRLELVHVVPQAARTGGLYAVVPAFFEDVGRSILDDAASQARDLLGAERVSVDLRHGTRVPTLVKNAADAWAVVLGFDPRPTVERLATGSTVNGVAARSQVPVIVVRPEWSPDDAHQLVAVGVKSTEASTGLLRRAFEAASVRRAHLRIIHAWAMPSGYDDVIVSRTEAEAVTRAAADRLRVSAASIGADYPEVEYDVVAVHGHPARVLATMSRDADLLMLERRRHPLFLGHLGGIARTLIRASECPVVVVPPDEEATQRVPGTRTTAEVSTPA